MYATRYKSKSKSSVSVPARTVSSLPHDLRRRCRATGHPRCGTFSKVPHVGTAIAVTIKAYNVTLGIMDGLWLGEVEGTSLGTPLGTSLGAPLGSMLGASVEQKAFSKGKGIEEEEPLPLPFPSPLPLPPLPLPVVGGGLVEGAADGTSLKPSQ